MLCLGGWSRGDARSGVRASVSPAGLHLGALRSGGGGERDARVTGYLVPEGAGGVTLQGPGLPPTPSFFPLCFPIWNEVWSVPGGRRWPYSVPVLNLGGWGDGRNV